MTGAKKIMVSRRALIQRINRLLAADGRQLRARRGVLRLIRDGEQPIDAPYFVVDLNRARVVREHVPNLEELGRELGAIAAYEAIGEGGGMTRTRERRAGRASDVMARPKKGGKQ